MARSLVTLVLDQSQRVTDTARSLTSHLAGTEATSAQEDLFRNITQQLMAIRDQLASELQQALEIEDAKSLSETG